MKLQTITRELRCPSCSASWVGTWERSNPERCCPRCGYRWIRSG